MATGTPPLTALSVYQLQDAVRDMCIIKAPSQVHYGNCQMKLMLCTYSSQFSPIHAGDGYLYIIPMKASLK